MNGLHLAVIVAGVGVAIHQALTFFRARRTGITSVGVGENAKVLKSECPGLFARNVWSRAIAAVLIAVAVISCHRLARGLIATGHGHRLITFIGCAPAHAGQFPEKLTVITILSLCT